MASERLRRERARLRRRGPAEGVPAHEYADHLLDIARTRRPSPAWASAMSMARPSTLERRISAMLTLAHDRRRPSSRARLATVLALFIVAVPVAAIQLLALDGPACWRAGVRPDWRRAARHGAHARRCPGRRREAVTEASERSVRRSCTGRALEASLPGFRTLRTPFTLAAASDWRRAVTLQVGDLRRPSA
jgi:hypothetical protein